jgi:hypothetical protein
LTAGLLRNFADLAGMVEGLVERNRDVKDRRETESAFVVLVPGGVLDTALDHVVSYGERGVDIAKPLFSFVLDNVEKTLATIRFWQRVCWEIAGGKLKPDNIQFALSGLLRTVPYHLESGIDGLLVALGAGSNAAPLKGKFTIPSAFLPHIDKAFAGWSRDHVADVIRRMGRMESAGPNYDEIRSVLLAYFAGSASATGKPDGPKAPYDLVSLQADAFDRFGISRDDTQEACQSLYEAGFLTYPRTTSTCLPVSQEREIMATALNVGRNYPDLLPMLDLAVRSKAWMDLGQATHGAIIPKKCGLPADASENERRIYDLVARRFLAQFIPG